LRIKVFFKIDGKEKATHHYVFDNEKDLEDFGVWLWSYMKQAMKERYDLALTVEATTQAKYIT
jgi:hypothetical protein